MWIQTGLYIFDCGREMQFGLTNSRIIIPWLILNYDFLFPPHASFRIVDACTRKFDCNLFRT